MFVAPEPNVDAGQKGLGLVVQEGVDALDLSVDGPAVLGDGEELQG